MFMLFRFKTTYKNLIKNGSSKLLCVTNVLIFTTFPIDYYYMYEFSIVSYYSDPVLAEKITIVPPDFNGPVILCLDSETTVLQY